MMRQTCRVSRKEYPTCASATGPPTNLAKPLARCTQAYEDLKEVATEYERMNSAGECFVHVRKRHSSNCDLRAMNPLSKNGSFHFVIC